jgi:hypothetical protein
MEVNMRVGILNNKNGSGIQNRIRKKILKNHCLIAKCICYKSKTYPKGEVHLKWDKTKSWESCGCFLLGEKKWRK